MRSSILTASFAAAGSGLLWRMTERLIWEMRLRMQADFWLVAACLFAAFLIWRRPAPRAPLALLLPLCGLLAAGPRLAADVGYLELCVYYGDPAYGPRWPELQGKVSRIMRLDSSFTDAALSIAGALAFDLGRPAEASAVLRDAARRRPDEWRLSAAARYMREE